MQAVRTHSHVVQFYESDEVLVQDLSEFVLETLDDGQSALLYATPERRSALESRLAAA